MSEHTFAHGLLANIRETTPGGISRDDERMRDPAEVAAAREFNRECRGNR